MKKCLSISFPFQSLFDDETAQKLVFLRQLTLRLPYLLAIYSTMATKNLLNSVIVG